MTHNTDQPKAFKLFSPILSGASLPDRLWACAGALLGICLTGLICGLVFGKGALMPFIVAPLGASAVLLFAVPASPLAQPWPIIGGNAISALAGVIVWHIIPDPTYAIGLAVGFAILAMSFTRSLHPPGGAAALTAVIGGQPVHDLGFLFPLVPVGVNSAALVALGMMFHKLLKHNYPHKPVVAPANIHKTADKAPSDRVGFTSADIDGALADLHETLDIDRRDIDQLLQRVEQRALLRNHGEIKTKDVMSKDVITAKRDASADDIRQLLGRHHLRTIPVVGDDGKLAGDFGYDELERAGADGRLPLLKAVTAHAEDAAMSLLPVLTKGNTHNVIIVDDRNHIQGVVSQTDLLVALSKDLLWHLPAGPKV